MEAGAWTTRSNLGEAMTDTIHRRMPKTNMPRGFYDRTGTQYARGENCPNSLLTADDVRDIRSRAGTVKNIVLAAEKKCSEGTIEHVIHRRTWKHIE